MKKILTVLLMSLFVVSLAFAAGQTDQAKIAKAMVDEAISLFNANGKEKTLAEISNPKGKFVKGELYVFAYDLNATVIAHPVNPKLIGKALIDVPDADGKLFRREIAELAKSKGSGWVDYKYKNPVSNKIEDKTTLIQKVGDVIICCGIYK